MSLIQHIDHIAAQPGVLSILVDEHGTTRDFRGPDGWRARLAKSLNLFEALTGEDKIHVAAGDITIMVQREPGGTAAIAVITGHEIRKSLRRMIRRCAKVKAEPAPMTEDAGALDAAAAFGV